MKTFFYFGNDYNAENRTSSHHIANYFHKKGHRVIYIESPGLRKPNTGGRDIKKIFSKIFKTLKGPQKKADNFYIYTLFQIPFHGIKIVRLLNDFLIRMQIAVIKRFLHCSAPIFFFVLPHLSRYIEYLSRTKYKTIYYCVDNYSVLPGVERNIVQRMDEISTIYSDFVFVVSKTLLESKKALNQKSYLSTHGVDYEHFSQNNGPIPKDMEKIEKPIIGYWGLIEEWFDVDLIVYVAKALPEYNIVLIGYSAIDITVFNKYKNIHVLDKKNYSELPSYGQTFDVCIMPYKLNQQVLNSNPMKLREYLSLGKPIVSVRFPEVEKYSDVVYISNDYEEYISNIKLAIKEDSEEQIVKRRNRASKETWDYKVDNILKTIGVN